MTQASTQSQPPRLTRQPITRRTFLKALAQTSVGLGVAGVGGGVYSMRIEPFNVDVTETQISLPTLPSAFDGFRLVHLTDLHFGEWMTQSHMESIAERVNALTPDAVVITGDFASIVNSAVAGRITGSLRHLQAQHGVFATLGNHDHWSDAPTITRAAEAAGVNVLFNEHVAFERGGERLFIAGVDDIWERRHDLNAALTGVPDDAAVVLLAHEPDYADQVAVDGRVGLQLSGHSHGGQVRLPGIGAPMLPWLGEKYDMGLYNLGQMQLYVSRGLGMIFPYVRFGCPPEIAQITLRAGSTE
ncbi:MAG: metallophosphoesterase [bacterium]|nr:metallophosphoesterase [bacterium]